jgi:type III secretion system (T3SS) SseB-like protein
MPDTSSTSPEITQEMRASAMANPNTWLYVIDPAFDADADIPPWGVVGAYRVDDRGDIDRAFRRNTEYRPSPTALRMPAPGSALEELLQLVRTGHRDQVELPAAVLRAPLLLYAASPADFSVTAFPTRQGTVMVPVCTSAAHVPMAWPGWRQIMGRDLAPLLDGHPLVVNPTGPITAMIPARHLG